MRPRRTANLIESISGLETVKIFGAESMFQHRWEQAVSHISTGCTDPPHYQLHVLAGQLYPAGGDGRSGDRRCLSDLRRFGHHGGMIAAVMLSSRAIAPMVQLSVLSTRYNRAKSALDILEKSCKPRVSRRRASNIFIIR